METQFDVLRASEGRCRHDPEVLVDTPLVTSVTRQTMASENRCGLLPSSMPWVRDVGFRALIPLRVNVLGVRLGHGGERMAVTGTDGCEEYSEVCVRSRVMVM